MFSAGKISAAVLLIAAMASSVHGHGQMTSPKPRPITDKYRADCYSGLKGAGNDELQWAPVENLSERKQADQPYAPTFDVMNGCRGIVYEPGMPVTELTAGEELKVEYYIQAPHPGYLELAIVKPKKDASGKIMYERATVFKKVDNFATNSDGKFVTATVPSNVSGCNKAGDCALQFYWHSDIAKQTYPTCADVIIKGGSGGGSAPAPAPSSGSDEYDDNASPSSAPSTPSRAPSTPSRAPSTPSSAPSSPSSAPAPAPAPTKKNCTRRRSLRV